MTVSHFLRPPPSPEKKQTVAHLVCILTFIYQVFEKEDWPFRNYSNILCKSLKHSNYIRTRPSKQCEFCNYLLDKSLISQGCLSGDSSDSGLGGASGIGRGGRKVNCFR